MLRLMGLSETHYLFDLFGVTRMVLVSALSPLRRRYYHGQIRLRDTRHQKTRSLSFSDPCWFGDQDF